MSASTGKAPRRLAMTTAGVIGAVLLSLAGLQSRAIRAGGAPVDRPLPPDLAAAIRDGDVARVRALLDGGADVNVRDADGNTPLILASFYAGPECVALLLQRGADPNAANDAGATALIRAASDYAKTGLLIAAGGKVRVRTARLGETPLILAARRAGNARTVKMLLGSGASATERDSAGFSPILTGAAGGDAETVRMLLDAGADPNDYPRTNGVLAALGASRRRTPLMWAALHNNVPMLRLLLARGADPNLTVSNASPLAYACWGNSVEAAKLLLAAGADVNARDAVANFTPLHWAASIDAGRPELVRLLLARGADPNAAGGEPVDSFALVPQTPRLIAERRGRTAVVEALIQAGAKAPPPTPPIAVMKRALPSPLTPALLIAATERAVAALQVSADESREAIRRHVTNQDCASCHQHYLPMAAVGHVRGRSVRFDHAAARDQIDWVTGSRELLFRREAVLQPVVNAEPAHSFGYELFGLAAEKVPPSPTTDAIVHYLLTIQAADGRWCNNLPRPPMQSGDVSATALALHAVKQYGWPGRKDEIAAALAHARQWLWRVRAETNEEAVFQLLGLHWVGEPAAQLAGLADSLLRQQRPDGGWAQLPTLDSDAYATGEALYALARAVQHPVADPAWQRGVRFLLERQADDGTWHVARRAFPFQPTMHSGFPYHRDGWISGAATSWAVLALSHALPAGEAPSKVVVGQPAPTAPPATGAPRVNFVTQIKPILERSCVACHGGTRSRGQFRLDRREALLKGGESGTPAIVPGQSAKSPLIDYVSDRVPESEMPPVSERQRFPALAPAEVALLRAWVDQGADWPAGVTLCVPEAKTPQ